MLNSIRARLTLWYTGVLALVLIVFASLAYTYLARATRQRTDESLNETANAFIASLSGEQTDDGNRDGDEAAIEAAREFRFRDRSVVIYDNAQRIIASSDILSIVPESLSLVSLLKADDTKGRAFVNLTDGIEGIRALALPVHSGGRDYRVVVARSLREQEESLKQARRALYISIPLALLIASVGGYFLARKTLTPVVAMSEQADHISAVNLHERLAVGNKRDELGQLAEVFNRLLARLDHSFEEQRRSFEQQRRFMADASHELRTPVAIMCGEAEVTLSKDERQVEEYRESLSIVYDEGWRLTRIVEDLFTLARADAGRYPLTPKEFYLDELVSECVRAVRSLAAKREVSLGCQALVESPFAGDEGLIRRMILNLLDNAIKHTPANGGVNVSLTFEETNYKITVTDTGAGIPPEAQPHIFERFYRADKARSRAETEGGSGAGLGLSIARWIAEAHHGRLELAGSNEFGSIFVATIHSPETHMIPAEQKAFS